MESRTCYNSVPMRRIPFLLFSLALAAALAGAAPAAAQAPQPGSEPEAGAVVCPPGVYTAGGPGGCEPLGPSAYLDTWAEMGIPYPANPLPAYPPDPALRQVPYRYFRLDQEPVEVYPSLADAQAKGTPLKTFPAGFNYISYVDMVQEGGYYFMLADYSWIPGKGSRIGELPSFQGLQFSSTPRLSFGWAIEAIPVRSQPGYNTPETARSLAPYEVVPVYAVQEAEGAEWYLIAPYQWVEGRKVGRVEVNAAPPEGVENGRWIEANLQEQTLSVYEDNRLVFATLMASGAEPLWTRPGLFQVYEKKESETMFNSDPADFYHIEDVPWTMYFDQLRALHGAYWRARFGYPQSHGCINLSLGDAHWLFDWATVGDWVYVHDPSGLTPTDPALYGNGAP